MNLNPFFRPFLFAAAIAACLLFSACMGQTEVIEFDERFSMNIVEVPSWFPGKKTELTPAQQEVIERRGQPDFIRFWWTPEGDIVTSSDFSGKRDKLPEMLTSTKQTWLYWSGREKAEIEFGATGGYSAHPLTEKLELLCRYGDPTKKSPAKPDRAGRMQETWTWIDHGVMVDMSDGRVIKRQNIQGTGSGTILAK